MSDTKDYVRESLRAAIQCLRDYADDAERHVKDTTRTPMDATNQVLHALAWGHANAMTQVQTAFARVERAWEKERWEADAARTPGRDAGGRNDA